MKTRKQIQLIRSTASPLGKLQAAQGQFPAPEYVGCENLRKHLIRALFAVDMVDQFPEFPAIERARADQVLLAFGKFCARKFQQLDPRALRFMADFLEAKRQPEEEADPVRLVLTHLGAHGYVSITRVRDALKKKGWWPRNENTSTAIDSKNRQIRKIAHELGVKIYGTIGRPKKSDAKRRKRAR